MAASERSFSEALNAVEGIGGPGLHVSEDMFAIALRTRGAWFIELGDLNAAEKAFAKSLEYAPDNKIALNEIQYIRQLAAIGKRASARITSQFAQSGGAVVCKSCEAKNVSGTFGATGDREVVRQIQTAV